MKWKWRYVFWLIFPVIGWTGYGCVMEPAEFSPARLAGAPVVTDQGSRPAVVFLSTHQESVSDLYWILGQPRYWLHIDLWAFEADELTPRWVQRLHSVRESQPSVDYRVIGVENGTVWAMGDRLYAVSLTDGKPIGNAAEIEARNPSLAGKFPRTPHDVIFETGLAVNAADGARWRIDPTSLAATQAASAGPAQSLTWPLMLNPPTQALKVRATVIDEKWYGMAHTSELMPMLGRGPLDTGISGEQNFGANLSYRLWVAPINEQPNPVFPGRTYRGPQNFAPVPRSPEFLRGGLLAARTRANRNQVISLTDPYRLLVLHQDRLDTAARQTLTCLGRDGSVCWEARLDLAFATGAALLPSTASDGGTIILVGKAYPLNTQGSARDLSRNPGDVIVRVALKDGGVKRIYLESLDMRALKVGMAQ